MSLDSLKTWVSAKLIPEWKQAWKYLSVQASAIGTAAALVWPTLDEAKQTLILNFLHIQGASTLAAVGFGLIILTRIKAQTPKE